MSHKYLVTGSAGFIGFHLCSLLLDEGHHVIGFDGMTDYYDVSLKEKRNSILQANNNFISKIGMLEDFDLLSKVLNEHKPDIIIHLAAQAGVRYSLENPRAYIDSNLVGTFNIMECAREANIKHLLMASTSSVYGSNRKMPFEENQRTDTPLTLYAATKKANESMAHSFAFMENTDYYVSVLPVYGPWGRPDMALFKFTKGIIDQTPIDIYNNGNMVRDFTYVTDLVKGIYLLSKKIPSEEEEKKYANDSISNVAPYRVVNIGNSDKVPLLKFIEEIEINLEKKAIRNYMEMQKGDVPETFADTTLIKALTGFQPSTNYKEALKISYLGIKITINSIYDDKSETFF